MARVLYSNRPDLTASLEAFDALGNRVGAVGVISGNEKDGLRSKEMFFGRGKVSRIVLSSNTPGALRSVLMSAIDEEIVLRGADAPDSDLPLHLFSKAFLTPTDEDDQALFGRVKATLLDESVALEPGESVELEVELVELPLLVAVTFKIEGADPTNRASLLVNGQGPLIVNYLLPDLADPMYVGALRQLETDMSFRYVAPIEAKAVMDARWLRVSLPNVLRITLPEDSEPATISDIQGSSWIPYPAHLVLDSFHRVQKSYKTHLRPPLGPLASWQSSRHSRGDLLCPTLRKQFHSFLYFE